MLRIVSNFPYMAIPLIVYVGCGWFGPIEADVWHVPTMSGDVIYLRVADFILATAYVCLLIEIAKATRTGAAAPVDHTLSLIVFVAALICLLLVPHFGSRTWLHLTGLTLIDVIIGPVVSIVSARRDFGIGSIG